MSKSPLQSLGNWNAVELAIESGVPLMLSGVAWYGTNKLLSIPSPTVGATDLELALVLGTSVALTAWAISRQMELLRKRSLWQLMLVALIFNAAGLATVRALVADNFDKACSKELKGAMVETTPLGIGGEKQTVCRIGGLADNPYMPGIIFRPAWDGSIPIPTWIFLTTAMVAGGLAFRDRRLRGSRLAEKLYDELRLAPAEGTVSATGQPPAKPDKVQACGNSTFWGEPCGQLYSSEKKFLPGERCVRCHQAFRKTQKELTFNVVCLFTADIDVLNGLERLDTNSWTRGESQPPDARIAATERWVTLGRITLPDVLTTAQALALVHQNLKAFAAASKSAEVKAACELAETRASKVSAWVWFGRVVTRLTFARPTDRVRLMMGSNRLRDYITNSAEDLTLQLDVGLLPVEVRTAFRKTFVDETRAPMRQNSVYNLWVPVAPTENVKDRQGVWVPRIEGDGLRAWLATDRLRAEDERGTTVPMPYLDVGDSDEDRVPDAGSLDLVRMPIDRDKNEPKREIVAGASISEWEWLEYEQVELLRQQCLVLVENR